MSSVNFGTTNIADGTINAAFTQSGLPIIVSLVAVALTESRMGRSRGRVSFVRVFAPIGTIGFLGVLKVHFASILRYNLASDFNLPVQNYASASRVGSMRGMNAGGIDWTRGVNSVEIGIDEETPLKVTDDFKYSAEDQVSYISRRQCYEIVRQDDVRENNYKRAGSALGNLVLQAIFCFGITIGSEYAANRSRRTLALFFCASVILTEMCTAVIEFLWMSISSDLTRADHGQGIRASSIKIYEQKDRIGNSRLRLREYKITRMVQVRSGSFLEHASDDWLVTRALTRFQGYIPRILPILGWYSIEPITTEEAAARQQRHSRQVFTNVKAGSILVFYSLALLFGLLGAGAELFTYAFYVTSSFAPDGADANNADVQREAGRAFGRWFAVQISAFALKLAAPIFDQLFGLDKGTDPVISNGGEFNFCLGDGSRNSTPKSVLQGDVRAANSIGVLFQTLEQTSSIPPAWSSLIRMHRVGCKSVVVPHILLHSGNSFLDRIPGVRREARSSMELRQLLLGPYGLDANLLRGAETQAEDETNRTRELIRDHLADPETLFVLRFVPLKHSDRNEAFYADIAYLEKDKIQEKLHYRIVTQKESNPNGNLGDKYSSQFVVWDGSATATTYIETEEASTLSFAVAKVNQSDKVASNQLQRLLVHANSISSSKIPLPFDGNFGVDSVDAEYNPDWIQARLIADHAHQQNGSLIYDRNLVEHCGRRQNEHSPELLNAQATLQAAQTRLDEMRRAQSDAQAAADAAIAERLRIIQDEGQHPEAPADARNLAGAEALRAVEARHIANAELAQQELVVREAQQTVNLLMAREDGGNAGVRNAADGRAQQDQRGFALQPGIHRDYLFNKLANSADGSYMGFRYAGRIYLEECYIHRYFNLITAQGRLTEACKQVHGLNYSSNAAGAPRNSGDAA